MTTDHPSGDHPSDEQRDHVTELALTAALADLVAGEHPADHVRERVADGLAADTALRRRWVPLAAAAAVVAIAVLGALVGLGPDDDGDTDIATMPSPTTRPEPEVLGDRIERDPTGTTTTTAAETTPTTTTTVQDAPPPASAPATTSPPTTVPACRNSTDPACGPFRWDPAPVDRPATLTLTPQAGPIVAGQRVDLTLTMSDPDGPVTLAEWDIAVSPHDGVTYGSSSTVERPPACPERYGPWTPPPPNGGEASTLTNITFRDPGTYTITVDVRPAAGCDNVDPYRSAARATITVEVRPAA